MHPYLIKSPHIDDYFPYGGLQIIPTLKVRERSTTSTPETLGEPRKAALDAICRVVEQRGEWWNLLGPGEDGRKRLDELILASGGRRPHARPPKKCVGPVTSPRRATPTRRSANR